MRAISSISFSGQLEDKIDAAALAGFDAIEIFREDIIGFEGEIEAIGPYAQARGLSLLSLQSLRDFEGLAGEERAQAFARAERFLALTARIGAPMLVVCANTRDDCAVEGAVEDLRALADMAQAHGLKIGFEALASSRHIATVAAAYETVWAVDRPNFGLVIGALHLFTAYSGALEPALAQIAEINPARIFNVHLADAPSTRIDAQSLAQSFRLFAGQGVLPLAELYAALIAQGYRGPFSMEAFNDKIRALPPSQIAADGMRAFALLEEARAGGAAIEPSEFGLVEFAAQGAEAEDLARLLRALGFAIWAQKGAVTLWRQGEITLAINADDSGLAHAMHLLQGLSVSGVGLVISDLAGLRARVGRFHDEAIERADLYGLDLLRGPGGSVFFLQDQPFSCPEGFVRSQEPCAPHLTHIDHVAQALQPNLFLPALLFYRASLDLRASERRDVLDPHGTVHSRTLTNSAGALRLSLNASFGAGTTTQRFLEKSGFAPFHHIAFGCDDLMSFAQTLDPADVLPVPSNYYEDLALRFDLAEPDLAALKAGNILYDRDAGGAYLQLYTRSINGFFFEIVERKGYLGMGAANAPVRMLSQLRALELEDALHLM